MIQESEYGLEWYVYWSFKGIAYLEAAFSDREDALNHAASIAGDIEGDGGIVTVTEA